MHKFKNFRRQQEEEKHRPVTGSRQMAAADRRYEENDLLEVVTWIAVQGS